MNDLRQERFRKDLRRAKHLLRWRRMGIIEGEEILVPTFEIASNPQIKLSEIKARRFHIVDRLLKGALSAGP